MPLQALPVLEIDGKMMTQSQAIIRYLAREYGFYGAINMETFRIDEIQEAVVELHQELYKVRTEKDETKKMTLADVLVYNITFNMEYFPKLSLEKWPKTMAVCKKVENHPKIAAWLKERPVTDF
ncbi:hypothetical protein CHS0354_018821 [Potamilus streckersoni]|uniref:Glutathione S-transferase n=1 Tax=Potamilus streckersoni TaxID=2493646 RepID=A0AAE0TIC2_9BIVA|nr:hypothetical protein CHS0354_018821 [Potamilus streckersoni]